MITKRVQKLEGGGIPAFTSYITVPQSMPAAPYTGGTSGNTDDSSSSKSSGGVGILSKEMIKAIYETGLPSDTMAFIQNLDQFMVDENNPFDRGNTISKYKLLLGQLAMLRSGKEQLKNAVEQSQKNGSFSEMAITTDGRYYTMGDDGSIHLTAQLKPNDRVLTNADLADLRTNQLPHNNNIATVIANGVSMDTINKRIWDAISKMGNTESSRQFFRTKKGQQVKDGIDALLSDSQDGTYEVTEKQKGQKIQAREALKYILGTLQENELALLKGKASLMGLEPEKGAMQLVETLLTSGMKDSTEIGLNYSASLNKDKEKSDKDTEAQLKQESTQAMKLQQGMGGSPTTITINPGQHLAMQVGGMQFGQLLNGSDSSVKNGSLESVLQESRMSMYSDVGNGIYVGNQRIDPENYGQVYINTSQVSRAWLPAVYEADGSVHPDFTLLDEYARIEKEVRKLGSRVSKAAIENIIKKSPLSVYLVGIDEDGNIQWDEGKFRPFLMLNAMAAGDNGWFSDNISEGVINPKTIGNWGTNIKYMNGLDEDQQKDRMSSILGYEVKGDIYSTVAYIPVSDSTNRSQGNKSKLGDIALEERNRTNATYQGGKTNVVTP